jgi:hypothetical protein
LHNSKQRRIRGSGHFFQMGDARLRRSSKLKAESKNNQRFKELKFSEP